jgi:hypothetical protein
MDRRDLLNGVNDFLSDSIVLPPGDFDKELLLPIIETAKMKKLRAKRHSSRTQSQNTDRINESDQQQQSPSKIFSNYSFENNHVCLFCSLASKVLLCKYRYIVVCICKIQLNSSTNICPIP